ncbi:MAG: tRNA pseudouridine(55) synthase TruB [Clostridia bacterium]|nr:tRNA pseudouridine(55) synthase TruB [Clostridia bacterium]
MTGFICVNKAQGVSSAREVAIIRRLTKTSCGHMGTLDPMATGVLPVAIGNAARLFDYLSDKRKTYVATFRFGVDSDTLDITGNIIENAGRVPTGAEIESVLKNFTGEIMQVPPRYSAKNIGGKRGYELARAGVEFELAPKKVRVYSIKLIECNNCDYSFEIECGGGTYIRSLARDIAKSLGTCAAMSALERTKSGYFTINSSVSTDVLTAENVKDYIIPTESVLPYDSIYPTDREAFKLFNGLSIPCGRDDGIYKIYNNGGFYGLAEVNNSTLKVRTKLC